MDLNVTHRTRLEKCLLAVKRRGSTCGFDFGFGQHVGMALQAKQIHVADAQHVGIRAAVGKMARLASFDLHGFMFENKRSLLVDVAGKTDSVLCPGSANLLRTYCAMRIMAIGTFNQPFVHAMVKRHFKLRLLL